jgi:hypothetical protein
MGKDRAKTLANIISLILSAPTMAGVISIVFAFTFPKELGSIISPIQAASIGILTLAVLPVVPIFYYRMKGAVDLNVSEREKRPPFFIFAILCYALGAMIFKIVKSNMMSKLALAYLFVSLGIVTITLFWKISVHTAGIAGPSTMLILVYGLNLLPIYLLTAASIWARIRLEAHTFAQAFMGATTAIAITTAIYTAL